MRHLLFTTTGTTTVTTATMPSSASSSSSAANLKPKSHHAHHNPNLNSHSVLCKHSPSATLDLLIFILVLFSCAFLLSSYLSYIFNSLSLLLSQSPPELHQSPIPYVLGFFVFFAVSLLVIEFCCGARSRKCDKPGCKGLKKSMEFDLQMLTEDCVRTKNGCDDIDKLPWKGGTEANPDYECLRSELRKMAPPNGRAVLLFRSRCGCPIAKLEGWGPKKGKRHKK